MIKIESITLEEAYQDAASKLECSVTQLNIEVIQSPSKGFLGLFKKSAIIVATKSVTTTTTTTSITQETKEKPKAQEIKKDTSKPKKRQKKAPEKPKANILNDTIMPQSFVSTQDDDDDYNMDDINFTADYEDETDEDNSEELQSVKEIASTVQNDINKLFDFTCFDIEKIEVSVYDENTLLIEFKGEDAALLIGKEGYRYKALSYMIFNWINTKYQLQLRLEIAEFLKNQEESVGRYLVGVCESIDRDGKAQTKILDGVLVQIALKELRDKYPNKYVAIRSTRDGLKFIIINDYHSN
ncbi:Jag N-terminal domain-containing protein [Sulfurimonas sp.]|nr:Jag N-terminal domain-containing protein [Sulfurimonas sp.]